MTGRRPSSRRFLMPRTNHRPRRTVSVRRARLLPLLGFRYSITRDAYVLRVIGNKVGPVYQVSAVPRRIADTSVAESETVNAA